MRGACLLATGGPGAKRVPLFYAAGTYHRSWRMRRGLEAARTGTVKPAIGCELADANAARPTSVTTVLETKKEAGRTGLKSGECRESTP